MGKAFREQREFQVLRTVSAALWPAAVTLQAQAQAADATIRS